MSYVFYQGKVRPLRQIKINPYDLGFLRGYAVFDVMKVVNQKPFLIKEHWKRLKNSAQQLNMKMPLNCQEYRANVKQLLKYNKFSSAILRTVLSGGFSQDGFTYEGDTNFLIFLENAEPLFPSHKVYTQGSKIISVHYKREIPTAKVTNYLEALRYQKEKKKNKALEIVFFWENLVLEASTSNIFIVKKSTIITPRENILLGITRNLVIKLAQKNKFLVKERDIKIKELFQADEVFLTASNKNIVPVVKVDNKLIKNGKVGRVTQKLMDIMQDYLKKY